MDELIPSLQGLLQQDPPEREAIRNYIEKNIEAIKDRLKEKIEKSPYWLKDLMEPSDVVEIDSGTHHRELHPIFEQGQTKIKTGNYKDASNYFSQLMENLPPTHRQAQKKADDWRAYALVRNNNQDEAKYVLSPLCVGGYKYPSAYWNLAHIANDTQEQLDALGNGIQYAPSMALLMKAVYLCITQGHCDNRLRDWLSQVPFLEGVLLHYYYNDRDFQQLHTRITKYILLKDLVFSDPEKTKDEEPSIIHNKIKELTDGTHYRSHLEFRAFWLQCIRPYPGQWRYNPSLRGLYYETCTDTYTKLQRLKNAAESFEKEITDHHLPHLNYLISNRRFIDASYQENVRKRLNKQLSKYYDHEDDLDVIEIGTKIFNYIRDWETYNRSNLIRSLIDEPNNSIYQPLAALRQVSLTDELITIGLHLDSNFRTLGDFDAQESQLEKLQRVLERHDKENCTRTMGQLLSALDKLSKTRNTDESEEPLRECNTCYNELVARLREELDDNEYEAANKIRNTIEKVIGNYPKLRFKFQTIDEAYPTFLGDGNTTAFSLRVETQGTRISDEDENEMPYLRNVNAFIKIGTQEYSFFLRDNLENLPVVLRTGQSVLLTFEDKGEFKIDGEECTLNVRLTYVLFQKDFSTANHEIPIKKVQHIEDCKVEKSKLDAAYIHGREIKVNEIEGHFFGRDDVKDDLMKCIKNGNIAYIEGIRRSGKTSLINSICHEVENKDRTYAVYRNMLQHLVYFISNKSQKELKLISVYLDAKTVANYATSNQMLNFSFTQIRNQIEEARAKRRSNASIFKKIIGKLVAAVTKAPDNAALYPSEEDWRNPNEAYDRFARQLAEYLPNHRVIVFWDDFQEAVELAIYKDNKVGEGILQLLRLIHSNRTTHSNLAWIFAGLRSKDYFQQELGELLIWAEIARIQIDFLGEDSVKDILVEPLNNTGMIFTDEAVARVYKFTQGYPEVVQKMADIMQGQAWREKRHAILPADADQAAQEIIQEKTSFNNTWCPDSERELSAKQRTHISNLIDILDDEVMPEQTIELNGGLIASNQYNEERKQEIDDLITRKILVESIENGRTRVGFKAPLLELWAKKHWTDEQPQKAAIFIDTENLTKSTRAGTIETNGQQVPLETVLDAIGKYAEELCPTTPFKFAAVYRGREQVKQVLEKNDYELTLIKDQEYNKNYIGGGEDDVILQQMLVQKISDLPSITHVVLVTGDIDFRLIGIQNPLKKGQSVHVLAYKDSLNTGYIEEEQQNPDRMSVVYLDELIEPSLRNSQEFPSIQREEIHNERHV